MTEGYECPYPNCRAVFVADGWDEEEDGEVPLLVHCPSCRRTFDPDAPPKTATNEQGVGGLVDTPRPKPPARFDDDDDDDDDDEDEDDEQ